MCVRVYWYNPVTPGSPQPSTLSNNMSSCADSCLIVSQHLSLFRLNLSPKINKYSHTLNLLPKQMC